MLGVSCSTVSATIGAPVIPSAPGGFVATAASGSSTAIALSWSDVTGETGYAVEQSANGSTGWTAIAGSPFASDTTLAVVPGLTANTTYYYRIRASNAGGTSSNSTANATTNPAAPSAPGSFTAAATASTSTSISLSWADVTGETSYTVEQSPNGSTGWTAITGSPFAANTTSAAVTGLTANTTYYYRIRANNAGGSSANSSNASAKTNPAAP